MQFLLFLLITFCSISAFANDTSSSPVQEELTDAIFPRTDSEVVGLLYQMLKVVDYLFTKHNIPYWIDGGTALGAVRHQGFIPWDDDADLVFHLRDRKRILALKKEFAAYGFYLREENVIRLFPSRTDKHPIVDLGAYLLWSDNTYRYNFEEARNYYSTFYWLPQEVNTLVRVPFGPLMLNAPNNMIRYLLTGYGEDCLSYATYQRHHGGEKWELVINEKVRIVDFSPAKYEIKNLAIPLD